MGPLYSKKAIKMSAHQFLLIVIILFSPLSLDNVGGYFVRIWNVGQGQWLTIPIENFCLHIDSGGEKAPWTQIQRLCRSRKNILLLTHRDRDHVNLAKKLQQRVPISKFCHWIPKSMNIEIQKDQKKLGFPKCVEIPPIVEQGIQIFPPPHFKNISRNDQSVWIVVFDFFLITGDSSRKMEHRMIINIDKFPITHYMAGHHGSKNSNSHILLSRLKHLKEVIVSARSHRYGHPHQEALLRFHQRGLTISTTQKKGSLLRKIPLQNLK